MHSHLVYIIEDLEQQANSSEIILNVAHKRLLSHLPPSDKVTINTSIQIDVITFLLNFLGNAG